MQQKLSERWSGKEVTSIKSKMVRKLFKVLTKLEIITYLYRENNKNNNDKFNNKLIEIKIVVVYCSCTLFTLFHLSLY